MAMQYEYARLMLNLSISWIKNELLFILTIRQKCDKLLGRLLVVRVAARPEV